jgi:methyltransferase family protein
VARRAGIGPVMRFDERWISEDQLALTASLAAGTNELSGEVVEIGAWQGLSAIPIANAIYPASLHVVDHWLGSEEHSPELKARNNYGIFLANMNEGTAGNFTVHKMGWRDWVTEWTLPIRFVHIDAAHTQEEVSDNIKALLPFAVPGAAFVGDDFGFPPVRAGVFSQFSSVYAKFNLWWTVIP